MKGLCTIVLFPGGVSAKTPKALGPNYCYFFSVATKPFPFLGCTRLAKLLYANEAIFTYILEAVYNEVPITIVR